ncbi:hypothetical protein BDA96_02G448000 [Sorghum bicolor]|uniref:Uncharacterized protein n=2 Tax=Sorghum bicolor TaxID=4558 RepID=A0A1W0W850_SORBI|nr:hypothetical protein BDA96_02G448000 [Sorghum bicolor]OQU90546.1 hypothetical protein SORBI_3002G427550 [Sorghum bicolor]
MARKPKRTRLDCSFDWVRERVRGYSIMPPVTTQPVPGNCGAHVAVEAFESRARILNAKENQPFPTLSLYCTSLIS